jgi:uncharacterized membrane protein (DUF106 family)
MPEYKYFNNGFDYNKYKNEIKEKRNEYDEKLNKLYKNRNVIKDTQMKEINTNVYANIMLTALATSILLFSFIKIAK